MALNGTMTALCCRRVVLLLAFSLFQAPASAKWWNILKEACVIDRNIQLTQHEQDTEPPASFGVDVSFPMHYNNFSSVERPFGDSKHAMYEKYMQGCRDHFGDSGWTCDEHEKKRIALNLFQPRALENYTDTGFKKLRLSKDLFRKIRDFWETNQGAEFQESWSIGNILANHWETPSSMLDLWDESLKHGGQETLEMIREEVQSTLEEWTGQRLSHTSTYGIRIYKEGSILSPHVDRDGLVSSAIINVAQDVDKPWPLEVIDRQGKSVNITMEPGDLVLYESHTLIHGRPYALLGRKFANIFVHFDAVGPLNEIDNGGEYDADDASQIQEGDEEEKPPSSFGVDVSFPIHHHQLSTEHRPFGDDRQTVFEEYMQGCRDFHDDMGWACDEDEENRIKLNLNQPRKLQNYTDTGYKKMRLPQSLWRKIQYFWEANQGAEVEEEWPRGDAGANYWISPTSMLDLYDDDLWNGGDELLNEIQEEVQAAVEKWTGQPLMHTSTYGVRIYKEGSILSPHVDRDGLVSSAIINVAQDVNEPWPLEVIDRQGKSVNITMEPGDMVLYESHTLIHGRPYALHGQKFANIFVHFQPVNYWEGDEENVEENEEGIVNKAAECEVTEEEMEACPKFDVEYTSIENFLNPKLFEDPETLADIGKRLRQGDLVVVENAFVPEFAEAMHCDLDRLTTWELQESYLDDGFHYKHHNIYNRGDFSKIMNSTQAVFEHPDTKRFMSELSGRDCSGDTIGSESSASYYMPGDHSLPHTDHIGQRTVAYVWHLSKNWHPGWGGALYWSSEHINNSYLQAIFNTLFLFSVSTTSSHFVMTVSPHAAEKRLSFNGWWQSSWLPSAKDNLEEMLATPEQRRDLTEDQVRALEYMVENEESGLDPKRREDMEALVELINEELWPTKVEAVSKIAL